VEHIPVCIHFSAVVTLTMTLNLEDDLDILKMYLQTENEVLRLRQTKGFIMDDICVAITSKKIIRK